MQARRFELPSIQDLTKDQEAVRGLPLRGQHLVIGGPGTGKSIVALLRTRRLALENLDYSFLVFNHLLDRASLQLYCGESKNPQSELISRTWNGWLSDEFSKLTGHDLPKKVAQSSSTWQPIDWHLAVKLATDISDKKRQLSKSRFLVIDEGQDMPPEFYRVVIGLGFDNLFVVADQNQQIKEEHSSRQDIEDVLAIETNDVLELRQNFRNALPIARLAREFYTNDIASPLPDLPQMSGSAGAISTPIYFRYEPQQLNPIANKILTHYRNHPHHVIGVITPNNDSRIRFFNSVMAVSKVKDFGGLRPIIQTWSTRQRPNVRFDLGGIVVINVQACKGLEFDVVYCADIDDHLFDSSDVDSTKKRFYVMVARAREQIVLLARKGKSGNIEKHLLPSDRSLLSWR